MSILYLKLHPRWLAYLIDDDYGVLPLTRDIMESGDRLRKELLKNPNITEVVFEKPFLQLLTRQVDADERRRLAQETIRLQRVFAILTFEFYNRGIKVEHVSALTARQAIYGKNELNKDVQLSDTRVLLPKSRILSPLQQLCLHDVLVLRRYKNDENKQDKKQENITI